MRITPFCVLTLEFSRYLACLAIQIPESAEPPGPAPRSLDNTRSFCPLFFPNTLHPNSRLAMFRGSMSRLPACSSSSLQLPSEFLSQDSSEVTVAQAGTASFTESISESSGNPSSSSWTAPKFFSDLSAFNITHFASGKDNLDVVVGTTPSSGDVVYADSEGSSFSTSWTYACAMLQLFYPKNSINPAGRPQGGSEFYATPLDLSNASSVTLEYRVFFPSDFDWVKGGKLPGLYGGHTRCSGGNPALDCFSTRLMWRAGGAGELYLVLSMSFLSCVSTH